MFGECDCWKDPYPGSLMMKRNPVQVQDDEKDED
jgi:hypothetical protein